MKNFLLYAILISQTILGQNTSEWIIYNTSNSALPSNYINHIVIDNLNRKWISIPDYGLLKIENDNWTGYNTSNSNIPTNYFNTINVDNEFNFWGGMGNLLTKFDGANWFVYGIPDSTPPGHSISSIVFDSLNNVWFLKNINAPISSTHYLVEFRADSIWSTHLSLQLSNGYRQLLLNNQSIWIGDGEGLFLFENDSLQYFEPQNGPLGLYVTDIKMDTSGNFWIALGLGGWGNLIKYDGNSFTGYPPIATAIEIDREGNIWVGTEGFPNGVELLKYDGTNWTTYNPTNSQLPNTFMITDLAFDTLGNLWIATGDSGLVVFNENGIVPVELISFSANVEMNNVRLNWVTASETNNMGFEIERKIENDLWNKIGFKEGNGTTTETHYYSFVDDMLGTGFSKLYYRLKQIEFDGSFEYSDIVEVDITPSKYSLSQNYPNPFNPSTIIRYEIPGQARNDNALVTLKVYDVLGNEIATLVNEEKQSGSYEIEWNASNFTSGIYFYQLSVRASTGSVRQFVETKKMISIK